MKQKIEMGLNEAEFKAVLLTCMNASNHIKDRVAPLLSDKEKDELAKVMVPLTSTLNVLVEKDKHYKSVKDVMRAARKSFLIATGRLNEQ